MTIETVNEVVPVIAHFDTDKVRPLRFQWRGRTYHVIVVNAAWDSREGDNRIIYFSVRTKESSSFELIYNTGRFVWTIGQVFVDD